MRMRIQLSRVTVKDLHSRLQYAYQHEDGRLVRRTTVWIDLLVYQVPVAVLCERWGLSPACLSAWQTALLLRGLDSVFSRQRGGRQPQFTPQQQHRFVELLEAGPLGVGCATACWDAVRIRVLIWREFGVLSNRHDVCT
jgi:hypothetical protein